MLLFFFSGKGDGAKKSNVQTRRVKIGVVVEDIDFDHEQCTVRVRGRNITENNWIPVKKLIVGRELIQNISR